jgi:hypothetical protein
MGAAMGGTGAGGAGSNTVSAAGRAGLPFLGTAFSLRAAGRLLNWANAVIETPPPRIPSNTGPTEPLRDDVWIVSWLNVDRILDGYGRSPLVVDLNQEYKRFKGLYAGLPLTLESLNRHGCDGCRDIRPTRIPNPLASVIVRSPGMSTIGLNAESTSTGKVTFKQWT